MITVLIRSAKLPSIEPRPVPPSTTISVRKISVRTQGLYPPHPLSAHCVTTHLYLKQAVECIQFIIGELTEFPGRVLIKYQNLRLEPATW